MESEVVLMLILQLIVIFFVGLFLIYFMVKKLTVSRGIGGVKSVLISGGGDSLVGIQISQHLASLGFRVFVGVSENGYGAKEALIKFKSAQNSPFIHLLHLDSTDENSLAGAIKQLNEHLHAGEKGLCGVIHLGGIGGMNRKIVGGLNDEIELRSALEVTVVGMLKLIRATLPLLSPAKGRFIILGADEGKSADGGYGVTQGVWTAARFAAEGLAGGLRAQLKPHGVSVISLHPDSFYSQRINEHLTPIGQNNYQETQFCGINLNEASIVTNNGATLDELPPVEIFSPYALETIENALLKQNPEENYTLTESTKTRIKNMIYSNSPKFLKQIVNKEHKLAYTVNYV